MSALASIVAYLEQFAPLALAGDWDNVGLLLGDRQTEAARVMTCLTVTPATTAEALSEQADLIVTHHPVLFRPVKRLTAATPEGKVLLDLLRAGIAVYSPHTAFDNTRGGINDSLAARLGLTAIRPLRTREAPRQFKLVVFVPDKDLAAVSDAVFAAGAGHIGEYRECSYRLAGTGTFHGSEASNPTLGQKGRREEVTEWRLEVVCPEGRLDAMVAALRRAHSYEEPAFDLYPLRSVPGSQGEGRIGDLAHAVPLGEVARRLKESLRQPAVQLVGAEEAQIRRIAIVCGAGGDFLDDAVRGGADLFVTGEVRFHDALAAQARHLALLLPGHYATERFAVEELAERLQKEWPDLTVWASRDERDPLSWIT